MPALLLLGLIFLLLGAGLLHVVSHYPGEVIVTIGNFMLVFNLWAGVIASLLLAVLLFFTMRLLRKFFGSFSGSVAWLKESRGKRSERRTHEGLIHFVEGDWQTAKKRLLSAAKDVQNPLLHYLAAAKSAYELGHTEETQFLLHQAEKVAPQNELAIVLSQARIQLADKKYEQALATLNRIKEQADKHPVILRLFHEVYIHLKDWPALVDLLPELKRREIFKADDYAALEENAYLSLLDAAADQELTKLHQTWEALPKHAKKNPRLVGLYCTRLHQQGQDVEAESIIRRILKSQWHVGLVELYGKLKNDDVQAQLAHAEAWLRQHANDPYLYLALGRLSVRNELWGKARDYFEKSLQIKERPEVYAELGALMARLGEHQKSSDLYQRGLLLTTAN